MRSTGYAGAPAREESQPGGTPARKSPSQEEPRPRVVPARRILGQREPWEDPCQVDPRPGGTWARRCNRQEEPMPGSWFSELKVTNNSEELSETLFCILWKNLVIYFL